MKFEKNICYFFREWIFKKVEIENPEQNMKIEVSKGKKELLDVQPAPDRFPNKKKKLFG